jgi:hypothetical protein
MFASHTKKTVKFGEESITIHKLSGAQIDRAYQVKNSDQVRALRELGGDILAALRNSSDVEQARERMADKDKRQVRLDALDKHTVLESGIESWSASNPVNADCIAGLEVDVRDQLFEAIVDLTYGQEGEQAKS